jgi:tRNA(Phe) wybutosine-synthesizing methylase Tyw3
MKFSLAAIILVSTASTVASFASRPLSSTHQRVNLSLSPPLTTLCSTMEDQEVLVEQEALQVEIVSVEEEQQAEVTAETLNQRLEQQLEKMRLKDQTSKQLTKEVS